MGVFALAIIGTVIGTVAFAHSDELPIPIKSINAPRPSLQLPALNEPGADFISPTEELNIRYQLFQQFERADSGIIEDKAAIAYINSVLSRLEPNHNFRPYLLPLRSIGASAFIGDVITVNVGLFDAFADEGAFVAVLAHENAHLRHRHISRMMAQMDKSKWMSAAGSLLGIAAIIAGGQHQEMGRALVVSSSALPYRAYLAFSRDMEEEADREGMAILAKAGYSPQGMVKAMQGLSQLELGDASLQGKSDAPAYLRTHPFSQDRYLNATYRAKDLAISGPESNFSATVSSGSGASKALEQDTLSLEYALLRYFLSSRTYRESAKKSLLMRMDRNPEEAWLIQVINIVELNRANDQNISADKALQGNLLAQQQKLLMLLQKAKLSGLTWGILMRLFEDNRTVYRHALEVALKHYPQEEILIMPWAELSLQENRAADFMQWLHNNPDKKRLEQWESNPSFSSVVAAAYSQLLDAPKNINHSNPTTPTMGLWREWQFYFIARAAYEKGQLRRALDSVHYAQENIRAKQHIKPEPLAESLNPSKQKTTTAKPQPTLLSDMMNTNARALFTQEEARDLATLTKKTNQLEEKITALLALGD